MEVTGILSEWFGGAAVSLPLTVVFLFLTDRKRFSKKWIWVILFVLYMNAMFAIVGVPDLSYVRWDPTVNWFPFTDLSGSNLAGMALNAALFLPFGGFITLYFREFQDRKKLLLAGLLLSLSIELLQLATFRATDIDDLIMNTLGTFLGSGIAKIVFRNSLEQESSRDGAKLAGMILLTLLTVFFIGDPLTEFLFSAIAA